MRALVCTQALVALLILAGAGSANAQAPETSGTRPGDQRPQVPEFSSEEETERRLNPPAAPVPLASQRQRLSSGLRVFVREVEVVGRRVRPVEPQVEPATIPHGRPRRAAVTAPSRRRRGPPGGVRAVPAGDTQVTEPWSPRPGQRRATPGG